jgi:predicted dinucleotide-binding enzyme
MMTAGLFSTGVVMGIRKLAPLALFAVLFAPGAWAAKIAVIGTGNVGETLGTEFAALGHTIVYGSREPTRADVTELVAKTGHGATATTQREAVVGADIVVLAVPGVQAENVVKSLGDLTGKIILDPTNRVRRGSPDGWNDYDKPANANSNAELVQAAAPGAKVVKAFNTLNVGQMANPATAGGPITIPLAGDDPAAKATIAELVKGMGLEAVDVGPLRFAHVLEEMLVVWSNGLSRGRWNYYLRPQPAAAAPAAPPAQSAPRAN